MVEKESLLEWNREGLIPGPDETEVSYLERVKKCLGLKEELLKTPLGEIEEPSFVEKILKEPLLITERLYGMTPHWVPLFFSNYQLAPWHGGSAWIFKEREDSPFTAFLQLRRNFKRAKIYLGIYDRDELIAHELCHVGRMMFEEPKFEEILAFRSAKSKIRRWLGPIVRSARETLLFILSLALVILVDLFSLLYSIELFEEMQWVKLLPLGLFFLAFVRLSIRQRQFSACKKNLESLLQDEKGADSLLFRLQDREIQNFAAWKREEILSYIKEEQAKSLRWQLLVDEYFGSGSL